MKRIWLAVVSLVLCAGLADAQSLVEMAKKEKERRKKNTEQGQEVKKFTGEGDFDDSSSEASDGSASAKKPPPMSTSGDNDDWDWVHANYQRSYDYKKDHLAYLQRQAKDCDKRERERKERIKRSAIDSGRSYLTDDNYKEEGSCDYYTREIETTKRKMQKIEADCANDARKRKILPGRARLRK